ncbi:MAG TPA: hypothetical protein DDX89_01380 [Candidatus Omnitrophica bacterium]|nr:MAG: hypothetical protein A2Z92_06705 [Omnitrophica WOR_2 bacterium GWA2_63_20]OGX18616.1 MAG: hypothetical protein A2105_07010 [Omnitrophica WOR_2 bacterium GWF2_63_9]OGX46505.1 MAG: hypothetical protein A3I71_04870 [Omnitrophica WOR_2 bacterium RIFCSPLOWO2_02_FULL_63_16]OGX47492.1 MAG: hypothetical protein A3G88_00465 [Omnitrophica WOR_2 bacterium RIFCSPLOWO2_12_FULL_63_16]HBH96430.1 hypothetical protein [Candidatus Omnitrophota bacterium]
MVKSLVRWARWGWLVLLLGYCALFFAEPINLTTADLGRHLKNGQLVWQHPELLSTNFYSYTEPTHPFLNHHWASGMVFFLIWRLGGFAGLHLFFIALNLAALAIAWRCAEERAGVGVAAWLSILLLPLLAIRAEVRPEAFSLLFTSVFFQRLLRFRDQRASQRSVWWLPLLEAVWVNLHSYFFLGPALIAAFLVDSLCSPARRGQARVLAVVLSLAMLATLLNPFGITGALVPLTIFQEYGYRLFENQTIPFLLARFQMPALWLFLGVFMALALSLGGAWARVGKSAGVAETLIAVGVSAMGWVAYRNLALFGLLALPLIASALGVLRAVRPRNDRFFALAAVLSLALVIAVPSTVWSLPPASGRRLGLEPGDGEAAAFIRQQHLEGPIFNNYDIGGYLIFHLFPEHRVFVDNRPEAYSAAFFRELYIPMQEDDAVWREAEARFGLNMIVFHRHDLTPWGQRFMIARVDDPAWAPVFADRDTLILLKRNVRNRSAIDRFEIPRSAFHVTRASP